MIGYSDYLVPKAPLLVNGEVIDTYSYIIIPHRVSLRDLTNSAISKNTSLPMEAVLSIFK